MSTLKVNNLQVGQDGTAANNYTLYQPASPDGTVRLGYGVAGSVTDILTLKNSRLGIGTNDPGHPLDVRSSVSDSGISLGRPGQTPNFIVYNNGGQNSSRMILRHNGNNIIEFRADGAGSYINSGNVGIGTSNPTQKLHIEGHLLAVDGSSGLLFEEINNGAALWLDGANGDFSGGDYYGIIANNNAKLQLGYAGASDLVLTSDGKVGIGTSAPSEELHINGSDGVKLRIDCPNDYSNSSSIVMSQGRAEIKTTIDASGGNPGGTLVLRTRNTAGSLIDSLSIDNTQGVTINSVNGTHALTVGDGGAINFRVDSQGRTLINTTTSRIVEDHVGNGPQGKIQIEATNSDAIMSIISAGTADANRCGTINLGRHRNSTVGGTPTIVQDNDALGAVVFSGGDGTDMRCVGAKIHAEVDGQPSENDMPGALVFSTTPDGVSGPYQQERLRISSDGNVNIGNKNHLSHHSTVDSLQIGYALNLYEDSYTNGTDNYVVLGNNVHYNSGNKYMRNDEASRIMMQAGTFYFQSASSGTAGNAITFTDPFRITSAGRIGINVTSPEDPLHVKNSSNAPTSIRIQTGTSSTNNGDEYSSIVFDGNGYVGAKIASHRNHGTWNDRGDLRFYSGYGNNVFTERLRITNTGEFFYGANTSNTWASGIYFGDVPSSTTYIRVGHNSTGANYAYLVFGHGSSQIGSVSQNSSGNQTLYNQTSDYRLKENIINLTSAITRIKQLSPRRFNFIGDSDNTVDGFIAHEVATVVPQAVSGTHNEVDSDNNPVYQQIDQSKLIPVLTAALKEAITKIETLESRVAALEG